jgi:hypothetical protein
MHLLDLAGDLCVADRAGRWRPGPGGVIRRGTFTSVKILTRQIRDYITHWNTTATPFTWTATADEILAKVRLVQAGIKKLVDNNAK